MGIPPKRKTVGNMKKLDAEAGIDKVMQDFSKLALKICRLNVLSASHRTKLETMRSDMLNKSDLANVDFVTSEYSASNEKGTLFITYVGYWFGFVRALNMTTTPNRNDVISKTLPSFNGARKVLEVVSNQGLDGIVVVFNQKKQLFKLGLK